MMIAAALLAVALATQPDARQAVLDAMQPRDAQPAGSVGDPTAVRAGMSLSADSVTVGSPFVIQLRVRAPAGSEVVFPPGPDTSGVIQPLDPPQLVPGADSAVVDQTMRYRVAAWDVGARSIDLGSVRVRTGAFTRELRLSPLTIQVVSVLPADTALRVPRPARPPVEFPRPWWIPWLLALLAAALVGLLVWWYVRRRRRRVAVAVPVDALADALLRFRQIDALRLPESGEPGRHVALTQDVLRDYLAVRVPGASGSLTSRELLAAVASEQEVPHDRLAPLLHEGDLVKFAAFPVTATRARELGDEFERVVSAVDAALVASEAAADERARAIARGEGEGGGPADGDQASHDGRMGSAA